MVTNSTFSGNDAYDGGAILNDSTMTVTSCTITGNTGSVARNIGNDSGSTLTLINSIVEDIDNDGTMTGYFNLIGGNPLLAPLGYYGGPTMTMPLLPGSPAIDAGASGPGIPTIDQRGEGRVGDTDIGAFESQGFTLTADAASAPQSAAVGTAFDNPLAVTVTANNPVEPVNGGVVRFDNPPAGSGARAIFLDPNSPLGFSTAQTFSVTVANGQAVVDVAPSNTFGSYTVTASAAGAPDASFRLTNTGGFFNLIVNTTSGDRFAGAGLLSLPLAIAFADLDGRPSQISFDPTVFDTPQTITLTGGQLELTDTTGPETIWGPAAGVTVSGGGLSRVFQVDTGVAAIFSGLTITGGNSASDNGGGLSNDGWLSLIGCTVSGNSAGGGGGGLSNTGTLNLTNCTVSGNSTSANGGGLSNTGTLGLIGCTVSGNSAGGGGGGVSCFGMVDLINCTVSGNSAGGGGGGGVSNAGTIALTNCTVSGNSAGAGGGGIRNIATLTLNNSIVANSATGGDIYNHGTITGSQNLIEDGSGGLADTIIGDPMLGPLADNGGPTQTMVILPGSLAIDTGSNALIPAGVTTDQRGLARIRGYTVDIGAFEIQDEPPRINSQGFSRVRNEGSSTFERGTFDDPQGRGTVTLTASVGSIITKDDATGVWLWVYTPLDGPSDSTIVTITATDDYGLAVTDSFGLTVNNVAPTASISGLPASGHSPAGTAITLGSTVTDPSPLDTNAGFTYAWSVTKNGVAYSSGTAAGFSFTPDASGTYVVTLTATDKDGGVSQPASATITVDNVAPATVAAVSVDNGAAQRSMVTNVAVTFSTTVGLPADPAAAFTLTRVGDGAPVTFTATTAVVNGATVVTLGNFTGPATFNGSLADGRYTLTVLASQVTANGTTLDGNGDGTGGDNYVSAADTYGGNGPRLYRLFGDANGDGVIDATDVGQLKSTFNRNSTDPLYLAFLDANGDGVIDATDVGQFKARFNVNVF
jgi:hypothetical protein